MAQRGHSLRLSLRVVVASLCIEECNRQCQQSDDGSSSCFGADGVPHPSTVFSPNLKVNTGGKFTFPNTEAQGESQSQTDKTANTNARSALLLGGLYPGEHLGQRVLGRRQRLVREVRLEFGGALSFEPTV